MSLDNLPVEWLIQKFEKVVFKIVGGGTPSKNNPEYYLGNIPWMSVKDMNKNILEDTVDHITQEAIDNSATNLIPKGTPIIATRMSLGKVVVANFDSAINQDLKAIFLDDNIDKKFFVYWYRSQSKLIESLGTGTTVKGIRLEVINNLDFPVVPLAEQQEIVRQLDIMLAQVEQIKARLDAIPAILKKFRQSLLEDSFSALGRLEELGNLVQTKRPISYGVLKPGNYCSDGIILLRIKDILSNIDLESDDLHKIPKDLSEQYKRTILQGKETLISLVGTVGRIGFVPDNLKGANVHRNLGVVAPNEDLIAPEFLNYQMQSESIQLQIRNVTTGANQPLLNLGDVRKLTIKLTDIDSQMQIVKKIKLSLKFLERIEYQLEAAQKRVNLLTQSILAKAFSGELTAEWREQHQELITGINSAESLLAKIQSEREASKPVKKTKKTKEV